MSLKAKLEAVIYAAEEPVTLAQLSALFAAEALEWKAEQAAALAAETGEEEAPGIERLPLVMEAEAEPEPEGQAAAEVAEESANSGGETAPAAEEQAKAPEASEAEARRQARLREREVRSILRGLIDELIAQYTSDERGVEIREIAGGYRMATKVECHDAVRMFVKSLKPAMKLSLPALETLAVIAYRQPVTAPEVNEIRGVDSSGVFGSLLARKLITTAGRKPVIGRPILYKTTREFLLRFGLKDVSELPSMEEFEKMAAIELDEPESESEQAAESSPDAGPELDENASEEPEAEAAAESLPATEAATEVEEPASPPSNQLESTSAEAAPGESPGTEQAETETTPHD